MRGVFGKPQRKLSLLPPPMSVRCFPRSPLHPRLKRQRQGLGSHSQGTLPASAALLLPGLSSWASLPGPLQVTSHSWLPNLGCLHPKLAAAICL